MPDSAWTATAIAQNDSSAAVIRRPARARSGLPIRLVFMSGDISGAQALLSEKMRLRNAERAAAEHHLARLREGRPESMETTSLHLDVLRDLKRIHSHVCSVAYPLLEAARDLSDSGARSR